jgi:hypothetical protein
MSDAPTWTLFRARTAWERQLGHLKSNDMLGHVQLEYLGHVYLDRVHLSQEQLDGEAAFELSHRRLYRAG